MSDSTPASSTVAAAARAPVAAAARSAVERAREGSAAVDVALVGGVALALGSIRLATPSFWVDESFTAARTEESFPQLIEGYHWLYQTLLNSWAIFAGTSEWALRFPSVLGAAVACSLLVILARRLFDRPVALVSGLLLATSPFFVKWSQQARGYTLLVAVSLAATVLLLRALERGSRGAWAAYGVAFTAVVVWHPVGAVVLVPAHVTVIAQRRERVLPHGLLAAVIVCALGGFWAGQLLERSTGKGDTGLNWLTAPTPETAARTLLDVSGAAGLGLALAILGLALLFRARRADPGLWLGVWAFGPFLLLLLVSGLKPLYLDRYLITAAPAFALLAAVALVSFGARLRAVSAAALVVATVAGLALWYTSAERGGNWRGEDWRSAVATVEQRSAEAGALVVVPWSIRQAPQYYGAEVSGTSTADSIWVLTWSETGEDLTAAQRRALGFGDHRLVERLDFGRRVTAQLWKRGG